MAKAEPKKEKKQVQEEPVLAFIHDPEERAERDAGQVKAEE